MEVWKSLDGIFDCGEYYKVSNLGNVVSIDREIRNRLIKGQDIKLSNDRYGYAKVKFRNQGKFKNHSVHVLVATVFIDNPENKPQVNHIDGNKLNNNVDNLEWVTAQENSIHASNTGLNDNAYAATSKPVNQLHKQTGELINEFSSIGEAAKCTGIAWQNIASVCKGNRKSAGGFAWRYA